MLIGEINMHSVIKTGQEDKNEREAGIPLILALDEKDVLVTIV